MAEKGEFGGPSFGGPSGGGGYGDRAMAAFKNALDAILSGQPMGYGPKKGYDNNYGKSYDAPFSNQDFDYGNFNALIESGAYDPNMGFQDMRGPSYGSISGVPGFGIPSEVDKRNLYDAYNFSNLYGTGRIRNLYDMQPMDTFSVNPYGPPIQNMPQLSPREYRSPQYGLLGPSKQNANFGGMLGGGGI
jgi:hypothetical protein